MNHLIEAEELKNQLGAPNLIIVDLCNPSLYQQQHVPGAIHLSGQHLIAGIPPVPGACPEISTLSAVMAYLGIDDSKKVVVYDDEGGGWAGRMAWSMDLLGLNNWQYLNGGIVPWIKEGFPTEHTVNQPNSADVDSILEPCSKTRIQADEILRMKSQLNKILAKNTGQTVKKIEADTDRDNFMTANQAKSYGIIDSILTARK